MKAIFKNLWLMLPVLLLALGSCNSSKNAAVKSHASGGQSAAELYKERVVANSVKSDYLTARARITLTMNGRDVSVSGNLKMKRGDVIQLSFTFPIIGEVGRMEFTRDTVLIVDRYNGRYVRVPYDRVDFLSASNIDFNVLESVFWNEVFYPGGDLRAHLGEYTVSSAGDHTLLSLASAPQLDYSFLTITESALLNRITVNSKNITDRNALTCIYSDFVKFASGKFPSVVKIDFTGDKLSCGLDITLSSLTTSSDWKTRSTFSSRYKEIDVERLLKNLLPSL